MSNRGVRGDVYRNAPLARAFLCALTRFSSHLSSESHGVPGDTAGCKPVASALSGSTPRGSTIARAFTRACRLVHAAFDIAEAIVGVINCFEFALQMVAERVANASPKRAPRPVAYDEAAPAEPSAFDVEWRDVVGPN